MKTRHVHSIPILCVLYVLSMGAHAKKKKKTKQEKVQLFVPFFFQMK